MKRILKIKRSKKSDDHQVSQPELPETNQDEKPEAVSEPPKTNTTSIFGSNIPKTSLFGTPAPS